MEVNQVATFTTTACATNVGKKVIMPKVVHRSPFHRLHGRQLLLPDSRHLLVRAFTAASRGTTPTLAPGRRRRDNRGAQLSPGHHFRAECTT